MSENETSPWKLGYPSSTGKPSLGYKDIQELAEQLNSLLNEKFLVYKLYSGGGTLKAGEFAVQTKTASTFTLPAATTANQVIGMFSEVAEAKIATAGGAKIYGDFLTGVTAATLAADQHLVIQSNGTNWLVMSGEALNENNYTAFASMTKGVSIEASSSRPARVIIQMFRAGVPPPYPGGAGITIPGGISCAAIPGAYFTFTAPAGGKFSWSSEYGAEPATEVKASWKLL